MVREKYIDIIERSLQHAKANDYRSNDVSDLYKLKYAAFVKKLPDGFFKKVFNFPFNYLQQNYPDFLRKFVKEKGYIYPQGQSMVVRAMVELVKKGKAKPGDLEEARHILEWLKKNRNKDYDHYCWGQPFDWHTRKMVPAHTPRATVSSQVAWAFIDMFELTGEMEYLDIATDVCEFFIKHLNYTPDASGNICFSYTVIDHYHVHNASLLVASVLMRIYKHTKIEKYADYAIRATDFSASRQLEDGSWYYWAPPDKLMYRIDNYHTGFVLEACHSINEDIGDDRYGSVFEKGMEYYYDNLFDGPVPKMTNKNVYPIDIQSCAQSIITLCMGEKLHKKYLAKAGEVANYTIDKFFINEKNHFGYRIYKNGFFDKSYYFRWGDAWMIRALACLA